MTRHYKDNQLYKSLVDKLKKVFKNNVEINCDDEFITVKKKSLIFCIEPYDENENVFTLYSSLQWTETIDRSVWEYNDEFQVADFTIQTENDVDDFITEFKYLVDTCDADKRVNKIWKSVIKLYDMVKDNDSDRNFLISQLCEVFDL